MGLGQGGNRSPSGTRQRGNRSTSGTGAGEPLETDAAAGAVTSDVAKKYDVLECKANRVRAMETTRGPETQTQQPPQEQSYQRIAAPINQANKEINDAPKASAQEMMFGSYLKRRNPKPFVHNWSRGPLSIGTTKYR